jgi:LacI family transcriptional regulator
MAPLLRIGLVFNPSLAYCRGILRGITRYAEARPDWLFLPIAPGPQAARRLRAACPSGVIAHIYSDDLADALPRLGLPVVNVCGVFDGLPVPRVGVEDDQCGRLAAEHFVDRGLRQFAFVGQRDHAYSVRREAGFRQALEGRGFRPVCYHERRPRPFDPMGRLWLLDQSLQRWIAALPRPVGIFAPNDLWGVQLIEVCRQAGLQVPEEVALLGVDNDDLLCGLARPPLSSVALPHERVGYEAAGLLSRLLRRGQPPSRPRLVPPVGVVARRSTDVLAVSDPEVAAAVRFVRANRHRPIRVPDILREVLVSRRALERRFRRILGRGLLEEIRRAHVLCAQELLAQSDLPMPAVAVHAGFSDARQLSTVFRMVTGQTPTAYRAQSRCGAAKQRAPGQPESPA